MDIHLNMLNKRSYEVIRNSNKLVGYFEKISKNKDNKENFKEIKELLSGGEKEIEKLVKKYKKNMKRTTLREKSTKKSISTSYFKKSLNRY